VFKAYSVLFNTVTDVIEGIRLLQAYLLDYTQNKDKAMCLCQQMQLALIVAQQRAEEYVIDDAENS
jgi:hypothetical protein